MLTQPGGCGSTAKLRGAAAINFNWLSRNEGLETDAELLGAIVEVDGGGDCGVIGRYAGCGVVQLHSSYRLPHERQNSFSNSISSSAV